MFQYTFNQINKFFLKIAVLGRVWGKLNYDYVDFYHFTLLYYVYRFLTYVSMCTMCIPGTHSG